MILHGDPQWVKYTTNGRERWNYVAYGQPQWSQTNLRTHFGYITKKKNKHRCRDWLVYSQVDSFYGKYICTLKDMMPDEAKLTAQLLIGAQA